jgi:hypothetical protein
MFICPFLTEFNLIFSEKVRGEHQLSLGDGDEVWQVCARLQADSAYSPQRQGEARHHLEQHSIAEVCF